MQQIISHRIVRPYSELAQTYDATLGVPFFLGARKAFEELVSRYGINFRSVADIGCGTGLFARYLNRSWGIPTFAVDRSPEMLQMALRNCAGREIQLLQQDIRCLQLPQPVDLITANFDTLNHLLNGQDLQMALQRIYENLRPGGHLIFDLITPCQPRRNYLIRIGRSFGTTSEIQQRIRWDAGRRLLFTTIILRKPGSLALVSECHTERAYSPLEIARRLKTAGFMIRDILDARTLQVATKCPPRIIIVAQKDRPHLPDKI